MHWDIHNSSLLPVKLRYSPAAEEHIYCLFTPMRVFQTRTKTHWNLRLYRSILWAHRFTTILRITYIHSPFCLTSLQYWQLHLLLSTRVFTLQVQTNCFSCFWVASSSCYSDLCRLQNNLGYCNIHSTWVCGKLDLWKNHLARAVEITK